MVDAPQKSASRRYMLRTTAGDDLYAPTGYGDLFSAVFMDQGLVTAGPGEDSRAGSLLRRGGANLDAIRGELLEQRDARIRAAGDDPDTFDEEQTRAFREGALTLEPHDPDQFAEDVVEAKDRAFLTLEELNARPAVKELGFEYQTRMTPAAAEIIERNRRAQNRRQEIIESGPEGFLAGAVMLGGGIAMAAADPAELATAFIPIYSAAARARLLAKYGAIGGRARAGFVEGAAGAALTEPAFYLLSRSAHLDYTMQDALFNIAVSGGLGAGVGGAIGIRARMKGEGAPAALGAEPTRDDIDAFSTALGQVAAGRRVDVAALDPALAKANRRNVVRLAREFETHVYESRRPKRADEPLDPLTELPMTQRERKMLERQARKEARAASHLVTSFFESQLSRHGLTVDQVRTMFPELGRVARAETVPGGAVRQSARQEVDLERLEIERELKQYERDLNRLERAPIVWFLKQRGRVDPESTLGKELRRVLGGNPQEAVRRYPSLFKHGGEVKSADNITRDELPLGYEELAEVGSREEFGEYVDPQFFIDAVEAEVGGNPFRPPRVRELEANRDALDQDIRLLDDPFASERGVPDMRQAYPDSDGILDPNGKVNALRVPQIAYALSDRGKRQRMLERVRPMVGTTIATVDGIGDVRMTKHTTWKLQDDRFGAHHMMLVDDLERIMTNTADDWHWQEARWKRAERGDPSLRDTPKHKLDQERRNGIDGIWQARSLVNINGTVRTVNITLQKVTPRKGEPYVQLYGLKVDKPTYHRSVELITANGVTPSIARTSLDADLPSGLRVAHQGRRPARESAALKSYLGNSLASRNPDGQPRVWFHVGPDQFDELKPGPGDLGPHVGEFGPVHRHGTQVLGEDRGAAQGVVHEVYVSADRIVEIDDVGDFSDPFLWAEELKRRGVFSEKDFDDITAEQAYGSLDAAAAMGRKRLRAKGIDGVLYKYGESEAFIPLKPVKSVRAAEFNPDDPSMLRQGERGFFNRATGAIGLLPRADASTVPHELGHLFLEILGRASQLPGAPKTIQDDMTAILEWLEVNSWRDLEAGSILARQVNTNTAAFKRWFGGSKVVDEKGEPLVVYHGTAAADDFEVFQALDNPRGRKNELSHLGHWFSKSADVAGNFAQIIDNVFGVPIGEDAGRIVPVYLSIKNPKVFETRAEPAEQIAKLDQEAHDLGTQKFERFGRGRPEFRDRADMDAYREINERLDEIKWKKRAIQSADALEQLLDDADEFAEYIEKRLSGVRGAWRERYSRMNALEGMTALREKLQAEGHDGIVLRSTAYDADGAVDDQFVAFEQTQIKSVFNRGTFDPNDPNFLKQGDVDRRANVLSGFHDPAIKAVEKAPQTKMTAAQWAGWLRKQPGVGKREREAPVLDALAARGDETLTREQILGELDRSVIELDRRVLGGAGTAEKIESGLIDDDTLRVIWRSGDRTVEVHMRHDPDWFGDDDGEWRIFDADDDIEVGQARSEDEAEHVADGYAQRKLGGEDGKSPLFSEYKIPGGENYQETLIRAPELADDPSVRRQEELQRELQELGDVPEAQPVASELYALYSQTKGRGYKSPHFDDVEILHLRTDDRQVDGVGRTLFVNELQSDLHQAGRRDGYATLGERAKRAKDYQEHADLVDELRDLRAELTEAAERSARGEQPTPEQTARVRELPELIRDAEARNTDVRMRLEEFGNRVPEAPFKGDAWVHLGIREALRKAAADGYDAISFARSDQIAAVVGENQGKLATLYDQKIPSYLKKYVKGLGGEVEQGYVAADRSVVDLDRVTRQIPEEQYARLIEALERRGYGSVSTAPNDVLFAAARDADVDVSGGQNLLIRITPEMREKLNAGQTLFQGGASDDAATEALEKWARGFEEYLRTGKAPTKRLARVFAQFKEWLTKLYGDGEALDVELSPQARALFDRILTTESEKPALDGVMRASADVKADRLADYQALESIREREEAAGDLDELKRLEDDLAELTVRLEADAEDVDAKLALAEIDGVRARGDTIKETLDQVTLCLRG